MNTKVMLPIAIAAILLAGFIIASPMNMVSAADKTIDCQDGCKINFKGKNDVDIDFGGIGQQGEKGDKGDKGDTGEKGDKGDPGADGQDGEDGKDAELSEDQVNALNFVNDNRESLETIIDMLNNGTLGSTVDEVPSNGGNDTEPVPEPEPEPTPEPEPEPVPENDTDTEPVDNSTEDNN